MNEHNVLITGGAGFIGSRLVASLIKKKPGSRIWIFDNLHPQVHGKNAVPISYPDGVQFVYGDVADSSALHAVVKESHPSVVYHLAAETGTGQSYDEPTRYCNVNVLGTTNLIEALHAVGSARRVVLAASRAVYGEGAYQDARGNEFVGLPRQSDAMNEGRYSPPMPAAAYLPATPTASHAGLPPTPASVYASTKLMQEYLLTQAGVGSTWQATLLRLQNVYGPGQSLRNPYTGVLSIFAQQLLSGENLAIFEDGEIARDFVFVDDVVDALVRAGDYPLQHGTILDIGSGQAVTILQTARLLMHAIGRSEDSYKVTGEYRIGDIRHACADIRAASEQLDWSPRVSISDGLKQLADWSRMEFNSRSMRDV